MKKSQREDKAARSVCFENAAPHRTSFIPCGKYGSPYLVTATAAARAALPIPIIVCSIGGGGGPNSGMAATVWDFLTCTQMLMHT